MGRLKRERKQKKRRLFSAGPAPKKQANEHVMIAIPTIDCFVTSTLLKFCFALERAGHEAGSRFRFSVITPNGLHPVEYARNVCVGEFLESDADRLWFLDADMMPGNTLVELLQVDADIVAGRMFKFDHANPKAEKSVGVSLCAMQRDDQTGEYKPIVPMMGESMLQDVDAVGTGSMLIKRHVIENSDMWLKGEYVKVNGGAGDCWQKDDGDWYAPPVFRTKRKPNGKMIIGEDLDFCERARKLGYEIKCHLGAEIGHFKPVDLDQVVGLAQDTAQRVAEAFKQGGANVQQAV